MDSFVTAHSENRYGLVAFAGIPLTICPLTSDMGLFLSIVDGVSTSTVEEGGSDIVAAVKHALSTFGTENPKSRIIVLISDGGDPGENTMTNDLRIAVADSNIRIVSVAVGSVNGAPIPDTYDDFGLPLTYKQYNGEEVTSRRNDDMLNTLAYSSDGTFLTIDDDTADQLARRIDQIEHYVLRATGQIQSDATRLIAILGCIFFVGFLLIPYRWSYA